VSAWFRFYGQTATKITFKIHSCFYTSTDKPTINIATHKFIVFSSSNQQLQVHIYLFIHLQLNFKTFSLNMIKMYIIYISSIWKYWQSSLQIYTIGFIWQAKIIARSLKIIIIVLKAKQVAFCVLIQRFLSHYIILIIHSTGKKH